MRVREALSPPLPAASYYGNRPLVGTSAYDFHNYRLVFFLQVFVLCSPDIVLVRLVTRRTITSYLCEFDFVICIPGTSGIWEHLRSPSRRRLECKWVPAVARGGRPRSGATEIMTPSLPRPGGTGEGEGEEKGRGVGPWGREA